MSIVPGALTRARILGIEDASTPAELGHPKKARKVRTKTPTGPVLDAMCDVRTDDSPRPGAPPIIRASGNTIIYFLSIDTQDNRRQLLRIRCDANGDVVAAICADWHPCNGHSQP